MSMNTTFKNALLDKVQADGIAGYIGLVNAAGTELSGGSPAYARKAVTWASASGGAIHPGADLTFDIPSGVTVGGFRLYSASSGGTDFGGQNLTQEAFANQGQYKLLAASTSINLTDPS